MKELAAFLLLIVLVVVGWNQPYKAHLDGMMGKPPPATPAPATPAAAPLPAHAATAAPLPPVAQAAPAATPARDASWMWKHTAIDAPPPSTDKPAGGKRGR